jgi:hypothetical protein
VDGEVVGYDSNLDLGSILGEDQRRYDFATADWLSAGRPERGNAVRFVVHNDHATQIYLRRPVYTPPLTPGEAIGAVYSIALGQAGNADYFGAPILWRSYLAPMVILSVLSAGSLLFSGGGGLSIEWRQLSFLVGLLVLALIMLAILVMIGVAVGVVALLGKLMGEPGRVGAGVLAYLWVEAALLQPAICILRLFLGPRDPTILVILLAVGLIAVIFGAGRVVKSGFQLGSVGAGVFIVVAAGIVGFILDRAAG